MYLPLFDESISKVTLCHAKVRHTTTQIGKYKHVGIRLESALEQPSETNKSVDQNGKKSHLMLSMSRRIEMVLPGYH